MTQQQPQQYRDRAKERRLKYGETDEEAKLNRLKEKYFGEKEQLTQKAHQQLPQKSIGGDNIGNKMLQKMGWKEGLGLGKTNQGRTSIIEVSYLMIIMRVIMMLNSFGSFSGGNA